MLNSIQLINFFQQRTLEQEKIKALVEEGFNFYEEISDKESNFYEVQSNKESFLSYMFKNPSLTVDIVELVSHLDLRKGRKASPLDNLVYGNFIPWDQKKDIMNYLISIGVDFNKPLSKRREEIREEIYEEYQEYQLNKKENNYELIEQWINEDDTFEIANIPNLEYDSDDDSIFD